MVNVNSAGSIAIRSFEKLLPERGLSDSVSNVLMSIREFTEEGIPALEFINYCISEYMRISDKKRRDENHVLEVLYKKENEREVPRYSSLFYNSAYKLMRNMDVGYQE